MKLKKQNNEQLLSQKIINFFNVQDYKDILQFAVEDVDLSDDVSSDKNRVDLDNYPALKLYMESGFDKVIYIGEDAQGNYLKLLKKI